MLPVILVSYGLANEITRYELEKEVSVRSRKGSNVSNSSRCRPGYLMMLLKFPRFGLL
jgi:hypothetical protein